MENEIKRDIETLCDQPEENRVADDRLPDASGGLSCPTFPWRCKHCNHMNSVSVWKCDKCGREKP